MSKARYPFQSVTLAPDARAGFDLMVMELDRIVPGIRAILPTLFRREFKNTTDFSPPWNGSLDNPRPQQILLDEKGNPLLWGSKFRGEPGKKMRGSIWIGGLMDLRNLVLEVSRPKAGGAGLGFGAHGVTPLEHGRLTEKPQFYNTPADPAVLRRQEDHPARKELGTVLQARMQFHAEEMCINAERARQRMIELGVLSA